MVFNTPTYPFSYIALIQALHTLMIDNVCVHPLYLCSLAENSLISVSKVARIFPKGNNCFAAHPLCLQVIPVGLAPASSSVWHTIRACLLMTAIFSMGKKA